MADDSSRLFAYVLCGGSGRRMWPLSRASAPKQFHSLFSDKTLFEDTLARLEYLEPAKLRVVASVDHKSTVRDLVRGFSTTSSDMLFEPSARNTAAAIALTTIDAVKNGDDPLLLIVPSDHAISTDQAFKKCVARGIEAATAGQLVLFGIKPKKADTGFGYIEVDSGKGSVRCVSSFHEKPDRKTAEEYHQSGKHFWNSGIFLARSSVLANHFKALQPEIWDGVKAALQRGCNGEIDAGLYASIPSMPFDKAVVEKVTSAVMVPATFSWEDIGSWEALQNIQRASDDGNILSGATANDCRNSLLSGTGIKIAAHGLSDIMLVATPELVYAAPMSKAHEFGELFEQQPEFQQQNQQSIKDRLEGWLVDQALPFWATNGVDWKQGGFHERLSLDGKVIRTNKRLRTMARQTWTFSEAARRDLNPDAERIAEHGLTFLERYARVGGGGFASEFSPESEVLDDVFQLYDHAMVLLACSSLKTLESTRADILASAVLNQLERNFLLSEKTGYRDVVDGRAVSQTANAHMHLLDALHAWHSATGDAYALQLSESLETLFLEKIYDESCGIAVENFDAVKAREEGGNWSPGHHYEWIHLLLATNNESSAKHVAIAKHLWANAKSLGTTPLRHLARLELSSDGSIIAGTSRSWAQCEAIRAILALKPHNLPDFDSELNVAIDKLFDVHLNPARPGGWIDEVNDSGEQLSNNMPASIFYHVFRSMIAVLDKSDIT